MSERSYHGATSRSFPRKRSVISDANKKHATQSNKRNHDARKSGTEGNVLFNDALNILFLRLYVVGKFA